MAPPSGPAGIPVDPMDLLTLGAFTFAYTIAVLVPGPGVSAVVARALGGGFAAAVPMVFGILLGDVIFLVAALLGLAALVQIYAPILIVVRWAGALYLLYIAWQFWSAKPGSEQIGAQRQESPTRTFLAGLTLTLGNPKTIVFYGSLLPTVVPIDRPISLLGALELTGIIIVVLLSIGLGYAGLAAQARDFFQSPRAIRNLNRSAAVIMAAAAIFILTFG